MRKAILFVVAMAMIVGGLYVLIAQLFWSPVIFFKFVIGACAIASLGIYLLWDDFLAPMLGIEAKE
jgi:hypothetical protein